MFGIFYQRGSYSPILESMPAKPNPNARRQPWQVCHRVTKSQQTTFWIHVFGMWKKRVETAKNPQASDSELVTIMMD